jgi:hypothetical protein
MKKVETCGTMCLVNIFRHAILFEKAKVCGSNCYFDIVKKEVMEADKGSSISNLSIGVTKFACFY